MACSDPKLCILSYCSKLRTEAHFNHQYYADKWAYKYIFDISPTKHSHYFAKIEKILKFLPLFDYIFWLDDDAFFCNKEIRLENFIKGKEDYDFIFCKSPINNNNWTYLSSGNFFIKNTKAAQKTLSYCLTSDMSDVSKWWDKEKYGMYTNGDQDALVKQLMENQEVSHFLYDYRKFNTRPFHFKGSYTDHFLVHFTGENKQHQVLEFAKKFNLSKSLLTKEEDGVLNSDFKIENDLVQISNQYRINKISKISCSDVFFKWWNYFLKVLILKKSLLKRRISKSKKNIQSSCKNAWSEIVNIDNKGGEIMFPENILFKGSAYIGPYHYISANGGLTIGDNVCIASHVMIHTSNHNYKNRTMVPFDHISYLKPVVIEKNVWIGTGAIILPGVIVGEGSVIAAGSVVTKNIPARTLAGGNPAKVIKEIDSAQEYQSKPKYLHFKMAGKIENQFVFED